MRLTSRPMFRPFFRPSVVAQVDTEVAQNHMTTPVAAHKLEKRPVTCCMRISALSWHLLLAVGILLCCLMAETPYDLPITSMPGYDNNKKLQEYVDTPQYPHEIAFDYQKFGLSSQEFYPSTPNYKFYSCQGLSYRYYKTYTINGSFTIYSNWAASQNLQHVIYPGPSGYVQYENGERCKDQQCRGLITGWAKVVSNQRVRVETVSTDLDFYQYNDNTRTSNCVRVFSSGFKSGLLIGVPSGISPTTPVKIQLRYVDTNSRLSAFLMLGFGVAIIVMAASCFFSVLRYSGCNCMLLWFPYFFCEKKAKYPDETEFLVHQTAPLPPQIVPQPMYQQQQQYQQPQYQQQQLHQPPQYQQPSVPQIPPMSPQPNKHGFTI